MPAPYSILLINEADSPNLGDAAIGYCLQKMLEQRGCEVRLQSFTGAGRYKASTAVTASPEASSTTNIRKLLPQAVKTFLLNHVMWAYWLRKNRILFERFLNERPHFDLAIIGGGQLFRSNRYFAAAMCQWSKIIAEKCGKKVVIFGVGLDPRFLFADKRLFKAALNRASGVWVRDEASRQAMLQYFGIKPQLCPDPVFAISDFLPIKSAKKRIALLIPPDYRAVYKTHNPKNAMAPTQYVELWCELAQKYRERGCGIVLGCTDEPTDGEFCRHIHEQLQNRGVEATLRIETSLQALCRQIAESETIVSGRMHALIIGMSYGCKCEAVPVSEKLRVFDQLFLKAGSPNMDWLKKEINLQVDSMLARTTPSTA